MDITHAFLRLQTEQDLWDLIALLKRGVKVCIEPVVGSIFGPVAPCQWTTEPVTKKNTVVRRMQPTDFEDFLRLYLADHDRYNILYIEPVSQEPEIRAAWEILNEAADYPLRAVGIAKLAQLLARTFGGEVECQLAYGHPEWMDWVKGGHGHLTFWHRPSTSELADIVEHGCTGIVRADGHREWYRGGLDFAFPDRGTLAAGETDLSVAYAGAGEPTGLGPTWDRVRINYRLLGLLCGPEVSNVRRNEIRTEARGLSIKARGPLAKLVITAHGACTTADSPPDVDRLFLTLADKSSTAGWLFAHWDQLRVVTFTRAL